MATVSNTCNGSYGSDCKVYLDYTINNSESDRISRNKSNITLTLWAQATSSNVGAYNYTNNCKAYIYIDGTTKKSSTSLNMDFRNKKKVSMLSWIGDVSHNTDGTLSITIKGSFDTNGPSSVTTGTVTYKWTLPKIPRASSVTCADGNIGSATTININRASSSFTHTITYSFQGLTGTIAIKTSNTSIGWTIPTSFYEKIPNANSGKGTITCNTYSGDILIGTSTCTFNAFAVNSEPSIYGTIEDTNTSAITATGNKEKLIRYISNAKVVITATAKNSATISSVKVVNGSQTKTTTTSTINSVDSGTFNLSCIDSRGLSASATVTKTLIEYIKPVITGVVLDRPSTTSNTINASVQGLCFNGSFGAKTNSFELKWRYKKSTDTSWSSYTTITAIRSGNNFSFSGELGTNFSYTEAYNFEFVLSDYFTSNTYSTTVTRGIPIIDIGENDININGQLHENNKKVITTDGGTLTGDVILNKTSGDTFYHAYRTDTGTGVSFGVGSGGVNHGVYSRLLDKWMIYSDGNEVYVNGRGVKSASSVTTLGWGTNNNYLPDISMMAYWNGAYSGTSSNLTYCSRGTIAAQRAKSVVENEIGTSSYIVLGNLLLCWGNASITPTANTPTAKSITFPKSFSHTPAVICSPCSAVPGTKVLGVGASSITTTGCSLYVTRTNTTATSVLWLAIGDLS